MFTKIAKIDEKSLAQAAALIKSGDVVAFPTETVYGLGASAFIDEAIEKVFAAKGRPNDNPLIVHVSSVNAVENVAAEVTPLARALLETFAPGPITVILKKREEISAFVTAGLDTVGVRIPESYAARLFLAACDVPVAAPSANTSKRPSPTTAEEVYADMNGKIPLILDGGACAVGIESTVVDCTGDCPVILRKGKITCQDIARVWGDCKISDSPSDKVKSPGVKYAHYKPLCEMAVTFNTDMEKLRDTLRFLTGEDKDVVVLSSDDICAALTTKTLSLGLSVDDFMHNYYHALRTAERMGNFILAVIPFAENDCEGLANRAKKSSGGFII